MKREEDEIDGDECRVLFYNAVTKEQLEDDNVHDDGERVVSQPI